MKLWFLDIEADGAGLVCYTEHLDAARCFATYRTAPFRVRFIEARIKRLDRETVARLIRARSTEELAQAAPSVVLSVLAVHQPTRPAGIIIIPAQELMQRHGLGED